MTSNPSPIHRAQQLYVEGLLTIEELEARLTILLAAEADRFEWTPPRSFEEAAVVAKARMGLANEKFNQKRLAIESELQAITGTREILSPDRIETTDHTRKSWTPEPPIDLQQEHLARLQRRRAKE